MGYIYSDPMESQLHDIEISIDMNTNEHEKLRNQIKELNETMKDIGRALWKIAENTKEGDNQ